MPSWQRSWTAHEAGGAPNHGMQATAYSLRFATLHSGFPPRLMPGGRWHSGELAIWAHLGPRY
jgi:hypothetical protein